MSFGGGDDKGSLSEINVTPLIDVLLVLLIIFMIAAPMLQVGVQVALPKVREAGPLPVDENKLLIGIKKETLQGKVTYQVYVGTTLLEAARVREILLANPKLKAERVAYIQADKAIPYGFVKRIMGYLREGGVESVGLVTDPNQ